MKKSIIIGVVVAALLVLFIIIQLTENSTSNSETTQTVADVTVQNGESQIGDNAVNQKADTNHHVNETSAQQGSVIQNSEGDAVDSVDIEGLVDQTSEDKENTKNGNGTNREKQSGKNVEKNGKNKNGKKDKKQNENATKEQVNPTTEKDNKGDDAETKKQLQVKEDKEEGFGELID